MISNPLSITIASLTAYPVLMDEPGVFGGAELQTVRLARGLAGRGHRVTLVTLDPGKNKPMERDGVRVIPAYGAVAGIPGLRFLHPRFSGLCRALGRAGGEVIVQRVAGALTGQAAAYAVRRRVPFVHAVASDADLDGTFEARHNVRDRLLYHYGLSRAAAVVAQTEHQRRLHKAKTGREAIVIPSAIEAPVPAEERPAGRYVLWVGTVYPVKRPELLVALAERAPDLRFVAVGRPGPGRYARDWVARMEATPNIDYLGPRPWSAMGELYRGAGALLNTSEFEGFSNTFLEAWRHRLPVCSVAADPDGLLQYRGLGFLEPDSEALAGRLRSLVAEPALREEIGDRGAALVSEHYSSEAAVKAYEALFRSVLARS